MLISGEKSNVSVAVLCGGAILFYLRCKAKRAGNPLGVIGAHFSFAYAVHVVRGERGDPLHVE